MVSCRGPAVGLPRRDDCRRRHYPPHGLHPAAPHRRRHAHRLRRLRDSPHRLRRHRTLQLGPLHSGQRQRGRRRHRHDSEPRTRPHTPGPLLRPAAGAGGVHRPVVQSGIMAHAGRSQGRPRVSGRRSRHRLVREHATISVTANKKGCRRQIPVARQQPESQ